MVRAGVAGKQREVNLAPLPPVPVDSTPGRGGSSALFVLLRLAVLLDDYVALLGARCQLESYTCRLSWGFVGSSLVLTPRVDIT